MKAKVRSQHLLKEFLRKHPGVNMVAEEVHPFSDAVRLATAVGARAFTLGSMIPHSFGYRSYKSTAIKSAISTPDILRSFREGRLPEGYGYRLDERIVEYPWALAHLPNNALRLLDAGSTLNYSHVLHSSLMKDRDITIITLDREGFVTTPRAISYVYDDLRDMPFKDGSFDAVLCLSTLEHVGLDNSLYTSDPNWRENDTSSYLTAVRELVRVTRPGGRVLISVPFGAYKNWGWFQVFSGTQMDDIREMLPGCLVSEMYFKYSNDQWQFSTREDCADCECYVPDGRIPAPVDHLAFSRGILGICIDV